MTNYFKSIALGSMILAYCLQLSHASDIVLGVESGEVFICEEDRLDLCVQIYAADLSVNAVAFSDARVYIGLSSGEIVWCNQVDYVCSTYVKAGSAINALAVSGDYVYVGLEEGLMWRCDRYTVHNCNHQNIAATALKAIAVTGDSIIASVERIQGGIDLMWKCTASPDSCDTFNRPDSTINALAVTSEYIFAGLESGSVLRCSLVVEDSCETFLVAPSSVKSLVISNGFIYGGFGNKEVWRCILDNNYCERLTVCYDSSVVTSMAVDQSG